MAQSTYLTHFSLVHSLNRGVCCTFIKHQCACQSTPGNDTAKQTPGVSRVCLQTPGGLPPDTRCSSGWLQTQVTACKHQVFEGTA